MTASSVDVILQSVSQSITVSIVSSRQGGIVHPTSFLHVCVQAASHRGIRARERERRSRAPRSSTSAQKRVDRRLAPRLTAPHAAGKEDACQREYLAGNGRPLLTDYLTNELITRERVVAQNDDWVALVPFWAVWPFETLLLPRLRRLRLPDLSDTERDSLAVILRALLRAYDDLFDTEFPYSMGWHGVPESAGRGEHWTLHAHFYPPLLRSASVKKFLVGYELLAEPQRDLTPEAAAERLRSLVHSPLPSHP